MRTAYTPEDVSLGRPVKKNVSQASAEEIPAFIQDETARFSLCIVDRVLIGVRAHARQDPDREVGGVLLGRFRSTGDKTVVLVTNFYPVQSNSRSATHFDFDERAQRDLLDRPRQSSEGVVGWFHSHVKIGDPFMSTFDVKLHSNHFKQPWHVSLVVGGGEWSMPVGFWRMENNRLIEITAHYIQMTPVTPRGEQSRRFLRACEEDRPFTRLIKTLAIRKDLALEPNSQLLEVLRQSVSSEIDDDRAYACTEPLRIILSLARSIGSNLSLAEEVGDFANRIKRVRFHEDDFCVVVKTDAIGQRISVHKNLCYSLNPSNGEIFVCDFVRNRYWPLVLNPSFILTDLVNKEDGNLCVLASPGILLRFPDRPDALFDHPSLNLEGLRLPGFDSEPQEMAIAENRFIFRTKSRLIQFELQNEGSGDVGKAVCTANQPLPAENCVLLRNARFGSGTAVGIAGGKITIWAIDGSTVAQADLPIQGTHWTLKQACSTSAGLLALLEDGCDVQVALFESTTMTLLAQYLQDSSSTNRKLLYSICADSEGKGFLRQENGVYLLGVTGAPSPRWYHYRVSDTE